MDEARRDDAGGPVPGAGVAVDFGALVAHARRLGLGDLYALLEHDEEVLDTLEQAGPRPTVAVAIQAAMVANEERLQPLVSEEAWRLHVQRCDLASSAELVAARQHLILGLVLGAAWQYRATLEGLHEWLVGAPLADPGLVAPIDHGAALVAAVRAADEAYGRLLGLEVLASPTGTSEGPPGAAAHREREPKATSVTPLVRAERVEVVDGQGRVRASLGGIHAHGDDVVGLEIFDADGNVRVWLALTAEGPELVFDQGGNAALELGVADATADALDVGAYVRFSDANGVPALSWQVDPGGEVTVWSRDTSG